jgi:hypothetical protein
VKLPRKDFINQKRKAITLMGMSGVGKTHLGCLMEEWGWTHYSCDYLIAMKYLAGEKLMVTPRNLSQLSKFVGQVGKGGLDLAEFKRRQKLYYDAECAATRGVGAALEKAKGNFVNDSTGSLCEIMDEGILKELGAATLFVYIKATPEEEQKVLRRARENPKPMFFPPAKFDGWLAEYLAERKTTAEEMQAAEFGRWVFPKLFEARLPKYQRLAALYGVTISSARFRNLKTEDEFFDAVAEALDDQES